MLGFKASKERPTLLLGVNAACEFNEANAQLPSKNHRATKPYANSVFPMLCQWNNKV